jgi:hypothetical protein
MAHFARIENGIVSEVIAVNNEVLHDENGIEQELIGVAFCKSLYGENTQWVQTSYNGNFRGLYAGIGMSYDAELDKFIAPVIEEPINDD